MRVLAIGDIHTKLWIINSVAPLIGKYDKVVFVGDYADDWMATPQDTIDTWCTLKKLKEDNPDKVELVLGNHDYIYVDKTPTLQTGYSTITQLLINSRHYSELKAWLKSVPITLEVDGVTYSHAGLTENYKVGDELWHDDSPIWARPNYANYKSFPQVFGHTPSETCWEVKPNVWCIDTFSTYRYGEPIGDQTVLEIIDGKKFKKIKMEHKK